MNSLEHLGDAISLALDDNSVVDVLSVLTGGFVGLSIELVRQHGEDPDKQIAINGGDNRDITIHAKKVSSEAQPVEAQRVPLTEGEISDVAFNSGFRGICGGAAVACSEGHVVSVDRMLRDFARRIEAAHGIKPASSEGGA